jgi:hypothetical protein
VNDDETFIQQYPPGYTVVHTLQQLREAKGPVWISCMTMLLQEIDREERLRDANTGREAPSRSSPPEF